MTTEKLGWFVFAGLAVIAALLYVSLPKTALIICLVVVVLLVARLIVGKRM
jgi:hypothetical protein